MEKNNALNDLMRSTLERVREMADVNTIVGKPITTPDGVTLIPVSRISFGFGSGGGYGKGSDSFAGGGAAGVRIDPVAFLTVRDGITRMLPVAAPPLNTVDRLIDVTPDLVTRVENYFEKRKEEKEASDDKETS